MLGAAPVSMGKSGRSLTSFGVSIPKAVVPNADAVAPNVAAGAGFGSSATLSSKEEIGLYARALETNMATRSGSLVLTNAEADWFVRNGSGSPTATS